MDRLEWANFAQNIDLLPGRTRPETPPIPAQAPLPRRVPYVPAEVAVGSQPGGLDRASWNRFRSGKLPVQRILDLHGRTAQRAFHALDHFLRRAHADHVRCVEVITGRGSGEGGGILRRELPLWLNLPNVRPMILAARHPHAANSGSVRLLLRRPK